MSGEKAKKDQDIESFLEHYCTLTFLFCTNKFCIYKHSLLSAGHFLMGSILQKIPLNDGRSQIVAKTHFIL